MVLSQAITNLLFLLFFKLFLLLSLFSTSEDFTLSPVPAEDALTPHLLPRDLAPHPMVLITQ